MHPMMPLSHPPIPVPSLVDVNIEQCIPPMHPMRIWHQDVDMVIEAVPEIMDLKKLDRATNKATNGW